MSLYVQNIDNTEFFYEILKLEGVFRGVKYYQVKNTDTGYVCVKSEKQIKKIVSHDENIDNNINNGTK